MESAALGLILDTSLLVTAERRGQSVAQFLLEIRRIAGPDEKLAISVITIAELVHGLYRATGDEQQQRRRRFIDDLKQSVPVHFITDQTSEIIGRIGAEQAARGQTVPFGDLLIGATAIEHGYAVATGNLRHFQLIPGLEVRTI